MRPYLRQNAPNFFPRPHIPPRSSIAFHRPSFHTLFYGLVTIGVAGPDPHSQILRDLQLHDVCPRSPPREKFIEDVMESHGLLDTCINNGLHRLPEDLEKPYLLGIWVTALQGKSRATT